jgi:AraC-like DNA-binding protein
VDDAVRAREQVLRRLEENRQRREQAGIETEEARRELIELLRLGRQLDYSITRLAEVAGISRDTAHRYFRS